MDLNNYNKYFKRFANIFPNTIYERKFLEKKNVYMVRMKSDTIMHFVFD